MAHLRGALRLILGGVWIGGWASALPAWGRMDAVPGARYTSGRAAALSDAYLPLGEDAPSALFYNPAVVGKIRYPQAEPLNFSFYGNAGYIGQFSILNPTFFNITSLSGYLSTLQANPGQAVGVGGALVPSISGRGFAIGVLAQSQVVAKVNADGTIRYRSLYQLVPAAAVGVRLAGGIVRLGYSVQWVNQASGTLDGVSASTSPLGYNEGLMQGSAISHNVGFALTLPIRLLPSLNIVARNILNARYKAYTIYPLTPSSTGTPPDEPMTLDASFSVQPKLGAGSMMNLVLEGRDLTNRSGISLMGRLAAGMEFTFRDQFYLRGGWGSGYPSAGLGLRRKGGEFSFSWYSEEIGTAYREERDTRFLLQYQVRVY